MVLDESTADESSTRSSTRSATIALSPLLKTSKYGTIDPSIPASCELSPPENIGSSFILACRTDPPSVVQKSYDPFLVHLGYAPNPCVKFVATPDPSSALT